MDSRFEIVEFYPGAAENYKKFIGTLHIYLVDLQMDIRGIRVYFSNKGWFFSLPTGKSYNEEEKRFVVYPLISFVDQEMAQGLKEFIWNEGKAYVMKKLTEIENLKKKSDRATLSPVEKDIATVKTESAKKCQKKIES